jgi:hypothetical protein
VQSQYDVFVRHVPLETDTEEGADAEVATP